MKTCIRLLTILSLASLACAAEASGNVTVYAEGPAHVGARFESNWAVQNSQFWPIDKQGQPYVPYAVMLTQAGGGEQYVVPIPKAVADKLHTGDQLSVALPVPAQPARFLGIVK